LYVVPNISTQTHAYLLLFVWTKYFTGPQLMILTGR